MEILVLIKQVPDDSVDISLDPSTGAPNLKNVTPVVNAFDTYALEMAARFTEANGGNITVASIGDDAVKEGLKNCLAVGASKAFLIKDDSFSEADTTAKAYILSKAVSKIEEENGAKFDIIFCGKEATDFATGLTGPQLAADLGVGCVTNVIAVDPIDGAVSVKQETEEGYNVIETAVPCVVTATKPDYDPRYPTMKSKMAARKIPIGEIAGADLGLEADKAAPKAKCVKLFAPPKRQAGQKLQGEDIEAVTAEAVGLMAAAKVI